MKKNQRINSAIYRFANTLGDFTPAWMADLLDGAAWRLSNIVDGKLPTYTYDEMADAYWDGRRFTEDDTAILTAMHEDGIETGIVRGFELGRMFSYALMAQDAEEEVEERIHEMQTERYELDQMALEMQEAFEEFDVYVSYDPVEEGHYREPVPAGFHIHQF